MFRRMILAAVLLSAGAATAARAQSVLLEPKFKTGDTNYIEQNLDIHQKMEGGPMPGGMEIDIKRVYGLTQKVEPTPDGGAKVSMTFDRTMQKFDSPMMEGVFDSDAPSDDDSPMLSAPLKAMVGGTFKMELDKEGKVREFSGMKDILEKVEEAAAGNPVSGQLRAELTDERGRSTWGEQAYLMYPNKEVKVGDTWTKTHRDIIPQLGKVVHHFNYKLDRVVDEGGQKVAIVSFTSKTEKDESGKAADEMPGATTKVDGTAKGQITYDVSRGMVTRQTSDSHMNVEIYRGGQPPKAKSHEKDEKAAGKAKKGDDDDDDDDEDQPKPMKVDVTLKQVYTVMSPAAREKQKTEMAVKAKATQEKDEIASKKKPAKKPAQKPDEDDDD